MCTSTCEKTTMEYWKLCIAPIFTLFKSLAEFPILKGLVTCMAWFITFFIHENVIAIAVLIGLVLIDQLTGTWLAIRKQTFSSYAFRNGLLKLLFYMIIVGAFHSLMYVSPTFFGWMSLDTGALAWLTMTEVISVVENSCELQNVPFPNWILDKLRIFVRFGSNKPTTQR